MVMNMSCGGALLHQLKMYGVDTVFGIPGVHTLEFYREIESAGVRHVGVRHEQGAGFMADGYARASGRPGVCLLITGPGVTNAATPIGEAFCDSVPMLVLSSVNASADLGMGRGALHEVTDQEAVTRPLTAFSATVHEPGQAPQLLARAFAGFASKRPRPVHIQIPLDVMELAAAGGIEPVTLPAPPGPDDEGVKAAVALIREAQRPVILCGGGAIDAGLEIAALADRLNAPVVTTIAGKGAISERHPLSLAGTLQRAATRLLISESDLLIVVGSELSGPDLFMWDAQADICQRAMGDAFEGPGRLGHGGRMIRIDIDADALTRDYDADLALAADSRAALRRIDAALGDWRPETERRLIEEQVAATREKVRSDLTPLERKHLGVIDTLRDALPEDGIVCSDMTQIAYSANTFFEATAPRSWLHPVGYGTLGYALPAAIGAKLACPERAAVAMIGDGGLLFTVQELATAAELRMPLVVLLWNNDGLGEIADSMARRGVPRVSVEPQNPDFLKLSEAFHCRAHRAESLDDLHAALVEGFEADGPTVIEVRQDAAYLP